MWQIVDPWGTGKGRSYFPGKQGKQSPSYAIPKEFRGQASVYPITILLFTQAGLSPSDQDIVTSNVMLGAHFEPNKNNKADKSV